MGTTRIGDHDGFAAQRRGGQLIEVVPDLELVLVVLAEPLDGAHPATSPGHKPEGLRLNVVDALQEALGSGG